MPQSVHENIIDESGRQDPRVDGCHFTEDGPEKDLSIPAFIGFAGMAAVVGTLVIAERIKDKILGKE